MLVSQTGIILINIFHCYIVWSILNIDNFLLYVIQTYHFQTDLFNP